MGVRKGQGENPLILLGSLDTIDAVGHSLISALEPLMIVVLGFIIGAIVVSLFMPLVSLLENLSSK